MLSVTERWKPRTCIHIGPWGKYCVECYLIPLSAEEQLKVNGRDVDIDLNKPGFKLRCLQHAETTHFVLSIPEIVRLTFTAKLISVWLLLLLLFCCCIFVYLFVVVVLGVVCFVFNIVVFICWNISLLPRIITLLGAEVNQTRHCTRYLLVTEFALK